MVEKPWQAKTSGENSSMPSQSPCPGNARRASDENSSSSSSSSLSSDSSRPEHLNPPDRRHRPRDSHRREPDSFDDEIAARPAGAVSVELKIQKDFTTQCHAAEQKLKQFEPKVHEARSKKPGTKWWKMVKGSRRISPTKSKIIHQRQGLIGWYDTSHGH